ncbi:MAG: AraC family transcriptional regulator [Ruthenibacterium sp.]
MTVTQYPPEYHEIKPRSGLCFAQHSPQTSFCSPALIKAYVLTVLPRTPLRIPVDYETVLLMVADGAGEARVDNALTAYETGHVFLLSGKAAATFSTKYSTKTSLFAVGLSPQALANSSADIQEKALIGLLIDTLKGLCLWPCSAKTFAQLLQCHSLLSAVQDEARPFSQRITEHLGVALLTLLAREGAFDQASAPNAALGCVEKAVQIIHLRYAEALSLYSVAQELGLSTPYLSTLFKQRTGLSFSQFLTRERISHAKQMLLDSEELVTQIAEGSGFSSSAHFGSVFRKHVGCSPLRYRKANRSVSRATR